jgi:sugar phosphate isomerase/epimerase
MKICLFTQSLFALPLLDAIRAAARIGFPAIELACAPPHLDCETARAHSEELRDEIHNAGLEVAALSLFNDLTNREQSADQIRMAEEFIALAPVFGTNLVKLTPGPPASSAAGEEHWQRLASAVAELVPRANEAGVRLAFETHMSQLTDTLASSLRFLDMIPAECVGLTVDFSNLRFAGERMSDAIPLLAPRMFHAHVKNGFVDTEGRWHFGALDQGLTDYDEVIALLRNAGYNGFLSIECLGPEARTAPAATARRDLRILERHLRPKEIRSSGQDTSQ